jgi:dihydrofolate reductase
MTEPVIAMIVAAAANNVIGREGGLPWRLPEDMKWFKARTMGRPIIMGRKTWESFPKRPLPGRTNIVVTRQKGYAAEDGVVAASLDAALALAHGEQPEEIMIIGGAELYAQALPITQRIYLTRVHGTVEGDAHFPALDLSQWTETVVGDYPTTADRPLGYSFVILDRKDLPHERA